MNVTYLDLHSDYSPRYLSSSLPSDPCPSSAASFLFAAQVTIARWAPFIAFALLGTYCSLDPIRGSAILLCYMTKQASFFVVSWYTSLVQVCSEANMWVLVALLDVQLQRQASFVMVSWYTSLVQVCSEANVWVLVALLAVHSPREDVQRQLGRIVDRIVGRSEKFKAVVGVLAKPGTTPRGAVTQHPA
ncbi:hypothetical protein SMMN14_00337 [Sphaerulina musiva]